ncbi:MAG TPA: hypothetical protein VMT10_11300 [Solirubrobacteraceae bacterium]|nr:hypothetical protein [Solirubrobacteraceae bacterium]
MSDAQSLQPVEEVEEVDAVLVSEPRVLPAPRTPAQLATTPAALATTSFLAGIATAVIIARRRASRSQRRLARRGARPRGLDIAASRSFLVDVHLLGRD